MQLIFSKLTLSCILTAFSFVQELIQYLKYTCPAHLYATSISPPAAEQIISAIKVILGEDGTNRGWDSLSRFDFLFLRSVFIFFIMLSLKLYHLDLELL